MGFAWIILDVSHSTPVSEFLSKAIIIVFFGIGILASLING